MKTLTTDQTNRIAQTVKNLAKGDSGELTIDNLNRELKDISRIDLINNLRTLPGFHFVIGRRNSKSRITWNINAPQNAPKQAAVVSKGANKYFVQFKLDGGATYRVPAEITGVIAA